MRFVPTKSPEQQSVLMLHRGRDLLMRQRTMLLNAVRAHLAEFGIITAQGPAKVFDLVARLRAGEALGVPDIVRSALLSLVAQLDSLALGIRSLERQLMAWHRTNAASQRLETIPGVGLITATALAASVPDPSVFRSGRQFAAYLGLVPRQNSSGGKERLGHISKMGNGYLRRLLVVGATSVIRRASTNPTRTGAWVRSLLERHCQRKHAGSAFVAPSRCRLGTEPVFLGSEPRQRTGGKPTERSWSLPHQFPLTMPVGQFVASTRVSAPDRIQTGPTFTWFGSSFSSVKRSCSCADR